ncbi:MAG: glycosyltransferase [Coriobacteriia bacterium]
MISVDGSTDGTLEYVNALAEADDRIRVISSELNRGRTRALNAACWAAEGEIVLRLDDDLLIEPDFLDLHAAAHAAAADPIGVVQPLVDVMDEQPMSRMWRAFVERNANIDRIRFTANILDVPPCLWGGACSCPRSVGDELGWYDVSFSTYGWEDIEFAYRLRRRSVRLVLEERAAARHLAHWTSFDHKLSRGFISGARMSEFAAKHGPKAVLVALGEDPSFRVPPRSVRMPRLRRRGAAQLLRSVAVAGERTLAVLGVRRLYDGWVARWLKWAYVNGWDTEAARVGLPPIPSPTQWLRGIAPDWREVWRRLSTSDAGDSVTPTGALRSAMLRLMERDTVGPYRRLRSTASAMVSAARLTIQVRSWWHGRSDLPTLDAVVFVEAATPSQVDVSLNVAGALQREGAAVTVLFADRRILSAVAPQCANFHVCALEDCRAKRRATTSHGQNLSALRAFRSVRALVDRSGMRLGALGTLQCAAESLACLAIADLGERFLARAHPKVVISASEYFAGGAGMLAASHEMGVPFVTVQHGNVNVMYAPFYAERYWLNGEKSLAAMTELYPDGIDRMRSVSLQIPRCVPAPVVECRSALGLSDEARVVALYSQSHGAEFTAATHFALAGQLLELIGRVPGVVVVIKRHPSERVCAYEPLVTQNARVRFCPREWTAAGLASISDVAVALTSTALVDAMNAGCLAIEVSTLESLVVQQIASEQVDLSGLAERIQRLLEDSDCTERAMSLQSEFLAADEGTALSIAEAYSDVLSAGTDAYA